MTQAFFRERKKRQTESPLFRGGIKGGNVGKPITRSILPEVFGGKHQRAKGEKKKRGLIFPKGEVCKDNRGNEKEKTLTRTRKKKRRFSGWVPSAKLTADIRRIMF